MEFQINGRRHIVQWQHIDDAARTHDFIQSHRPKNIGNQYKGRIPLKEARFIGMTICRIKVELPEPKGQQRFETICEGYAFRRIDEPGYDRDAARRHSFAHALTDNFTHADRTVAWTAFNAVWPPSARPPRPIRSRRVDLSLCEISARLAAIERAITPAYPLPDVGSSAR